MRTFLVLVRRILGAGLLPVAAGIAVIGASAILVLASQITDSVVAVCLAALAVSLVLGTAFGALAFRVAGTRTPRGHGHRFGLLLTAFMAIAAGALLFQPLELPAGTVQPRADIQYWQLSTGSRLAFTHYPAVGWRHAEPIVFLHGGPGAPLRDSDYRFFQRFAQDGYDVYLYEQAGTGRSDALSDVRDYTVQRHMDDLEAIREKIGAQRLILVGQSWGAALAANYTAAHPGRVAKLIFPSPGPMRHGERIQADLSRTAQVGPQAPPPLRVQAAALLAEVNPALAANFASPAEMSRYMDTVAPLLMNESYCAGDAPRVPPAGASGFNFYANRVTQQDLDVRQDPHPALRASPVPALIMKGECDYVPWIVALDYRYALPNARLVYLEHTGHLLWGGQPELSFQVMRAFLDGERLPAPEILL
jgi:pimeloyl-ACP methyl ester carboxylesterase